MRKLFLTLGAIVLVAVAGAVYFVSFRLDSAVERHIEKAASMAMGTAVEVAGVQTSLRDGTLKIAEISIANPPGYENPIAARLHALEAAVDYSAREITHMVIENPEFIIEERDGTTNFGQMLESIEAGSKAGPGTASDGGSNEGGVPANEPVISIRHFRINDTRAVFESQSFDRYTDIKVDAIEMHNLRGTPSELAEQIAQEVVGELSSEAAAEILKAQAKKQLKNVRGKAGDILRDMLGRDSDDSGDEGGDQGGDGGSR